MWSCAESFWAKAQVSGSIGHYLSLRCFLPVCVPIPPVTPAPDELWTGVSPKSTRQASRRRQGARTQLANAGQGSVANSNDRGSLIFHSLKPAACTILRGRFPLGKGRWYNTDNILLQPLYISPLLCQQA